MLIKDLIETVRCDYLEDTNADKYLWSDHSLLRKFSEAERQACNRGNLIYDDSTPQYTQIKLVNGKASYAFDSKLTIIENIFINGTEVIRKSKDELSLYSPTWRTDTGMLGKTVMAVISGRTIRFTPEPDAIDAGTIVTLEVYRLPDAEIISMHQEPEIPAENHRDLIYWVLHECYKKQDADSFNQEKSDYYLKRFNEIFGDYVSAKVRAHQFEEPRNRIILRPTPYTISMQYDNDSGW